MIFSAVKKPLSIPMKSGQRLAEGDPTVPIVMVSTARAGATDISAAMANPNAARPNILIIAMIILRVHSVRTQSMTAGHRSAHKVLTVRSSVYFFLADLLYVGASFLSCAR